MIGHGQFVFVDTSAWYALVAEGEDRNADAKRLLAALNQLRVELVTSNFVLAETHALILRRRGRFDALAWLNRLRLDQVAEIIRVEEPDEDRAVQIIEQFADKAFSYTDATSFSIMDRLGLTTAFSFDRHFAQFGRTTLGLDG